MRNFFILKTSTVRFAQWSGKRYAVFSSLHKVMAIAFLSVSYFLTLSTHLVRAQTTDTLDLNTVVVNAERTADVYESVARNLKIITAEDLNELPLSSIPELLEYVANVDARTRGAEGIQQDISMRGGTFAQVLILLDGTPMIDPQTAHHNANIPVLKEQIARIEILSGPASRKYGANAFSGAINIVTKKQANALQISAEAGSFGYANSAVNYARSNPKSYHNIGAGVKRSDGFTNNTDFETFDLAYLAGIKFENSNLNFKLSHQTKQFGANSFYSAKFPDQYERTHANLLNASYERQGTFHFLANFYYRRHQDRFELFRYEKPSWYTSHNYHVSHAVGASVGTHTQTLFGQTSLSFDYRNELIYSNVLGMQMSDTLLCAFDSDAFFTKTKARNQFNLMLDHAYHRTKASVSAGLLAHYNDAYGWALSPGIDFLYRISNQLRLVASANSGMRFPSFTNLYYTTATNVSDPNLEPEYSQSAEFGVKWRSEKWEFEHVFFARQSKNVIDWVYQANTEIWYSQNIAQIAALGIESRLTISPSTEWWENILFDFMYLQQKNNTTHYSSSYAMDYLKYKFLVRTNFRLIKKVNLLFNVTGQDRAGNYFLGDVEKQYPPFVVFDAKINVALRKTQFYISANNLFNQTYNDYGSVSMPGRWLKMGVMFINKYKN